MNHDRSLDDRQWPLPQHPWVMRMRWSELLFAHWSVDPNLISERLPEGLRVDTHQGRAWVGVVPFLMSDVAPRGCPALPWLSRFLELNVRTYVIRDGKPGVWFFSLDAENPVAVRAARASFHLPYMDADMGLRRESSDEVRYRSQRTHRNESPAALDMTYRSVGDSFHASPGTFEYWLTARYCLYSANRRGTVFRGEISHVPWALRPAECSLQTNSMGDALGFDFSGPPHLLAAESIDVRAWWPTRCREDAPTDREVNRTQPPRDRTTGAPRG